RIVAVLADEQHAIDGELARAERERAGDRVIDGEAVLPGEVAAHVVIWELIDVRADELERGKLALAVERVALNEARGEDVGVRIVPPDGSHDSNAGEFFLGVGRNSNQQQ